MESPARTHHPRAARAVDAALVVAAFAAIAVGFATWIQNGVPYINAMTMFVLLSSVLLICVLLRSDDRVVSRIVSPIVLSGSLAVIASPLAPNTGQQVLPLWGVGVLLAYALTLRVRFPQVLPLLSTLLVAGQALALAAPLASTASANGQLLTGLLTFAGTAVPLAWIRERLYGRPLVPPTQTGRALRFTLGGAAYTVGLVAALNVLYVDEGNVWAAVAVASVVVLVALVVWQFVRIARLRHESEALLRAAVATPWPEDETEDLMLSLISEHVRMDSVGLEPEPGPHDTISEQLLPGKWLVVRRRQGDAAFSRFDADLVAGVAALGRSSYVQAATERRLYADAVTDDLTGLFKYKPWRTILDDHIEHREPGEVFGVVFFDLDYFKQINETFGHLRADIALATIGKRLVGMSRHWRFARFGGDEFVGIRREVRDEQHLDEECGALQKVLSEPVSANGRNIVLGVTIGRTLSEDPTDNPSRIVGRAERDLRRRKSLRPVRDAQPTDAELLQGLLEGGLNVAYQPVFALPSRTLHGWEALLRGEIPGQGEVPAPDLVAAARRLDQLDVVTRKVAEAALDTADQVCRRLGRRISMSINVETDQLRWESEALDWIGRRARTSPAEVILEITERGDTEWDEEQYEVVEDLERQGIRLALDDYGAGQSRLRAVARRRWHWVKMDRDFLTSEEDGLMLLRHNVMAMHELGQPVVLEGLEEEHQVELAESLGIDYGQGYWLSAPRSTQELFADLDKLPAPPG